MHNIDTFAGRLVHRSQTCLRPALLTVAVALAATFAGCSSDAEAGSAEAKTDASLSDGATPAPSAQAAVESLLRAEQAGDRVKSFRLLAPASRATYPSEVEWTRRRNELPAVTGFSVDKEVEDGTVAALVEHRPGLDPFVGLSAARERQVWKVVKSDAGWLVEAEPTVEVLLPDEAGASSAALQWARAVQACDRPAARAAQATDLVVGAATGPDQLCRTSGAVAAARAARTPGGPGTQPLVAEYGADVLEWSRTVAITGGPRPFSLVLAPLGDTWKVVGVFE